MALNRELTRTVGNMWYQTQYDNCFSATSRMLLMQVYVIPS